MSDLTAVGITAGYDGPPVLDKAHTTTVILGPNGAGKSTLAKAIVGLLTIREGTVTLLGENITGMGPHKLVRRGLAYLPQLMNIFDQMSVIENLEMGGYTIQGSLNQRVDTVFELFPDLAKDRHKKSGELSGGQQRMLALARLLMTDPKVAILDEPTAGLSPLYAERVWEQIDRIRGLGVGLLADSVFLLAQGRNVTSGPTAEVRGRDEVARILVG